MRYHSKNIKSVIVKMLRIIGYKPKAIAKMIGMSQATIYRYLK